MMNKEKLDKEINDLLKDIDKLPKAITVSQSKFDDMSLTPSHQPSFACWLGVFPIRLEKEQIEDYQIVT